MASRRSFLKRSTVSALSGIIASGTSPAIVKARTKRSSVTMEEARKVHDRMLIIDGHNDTPVERIHRGEQPIDWMRRDMDYHTDVPRMRESGYDTGFFIVGNGNTANVWVTAEHILRQIEAHPDALMQVTTSRDAAAAKESGRLGVMLSIEGIGRWLDGKPDILMTFYRLGVRLAGITHGEGGKEASFMQGTKSPYGAATPEEREVERKNAGGLSPFGREVLALSNELGMVTDLSHINDRAFYEVLERSETPPIMSHTAAYGLCHQWRCLTDDQIRALADAGGVMGFAFVPSFLDDDPGKATLDRFVEHLMYTADLVGIDHVGIGSDYDGTSQPLVVPEVSKLPELTRTMLEHGFTEEDIAKIWGGNYMRILGKTIDKTG